MTATSIEKELIELETRYWNAMKDGDARAAADLSGDPCVVAGASGVAALDRTTLTKMMSAGTWKLTSFALSSPVVRLVDHDVAVVAYKVHEELTVDGKRVSLDAADMSTWVRRGGQWLCVAHSEALLGDSFGRDRVAPARG